MAQDYENQLKTFKDELEILKQEKEVMNQETMETKRNSQTTGQQSAKQIVSVGHEISRVQLREIRNRIL